MMNGSNSLCPVTLLQCHPLVAMVDVRAILESLHTRGGGEAGGKRGVCPLGGRWLTSDTAMKAVVSDSPLSTASPC